MARTVYQTHRISISAFKECFKHEESNGTANTGGGSIYFKCTNYEKRAVFKFSYSVSFEGEHLGDIENIIHVEKVPSNLGDWLVPYFVCPDTGRRCRYLYFDNIDCRYKSIHAQKEKLYYPTQLASKNSYPFDKYHTLRRKVEGIEQGRKRKQTTFKGNLTKHELRLSGLKIKKLHAYAKAVNKFRLYVDAMKR